VAGRGELSLDSTRAWCRKDGDGWLLAIRVQPNSSVSASWPGRSVPRASVRVVRGQSGRSKTVRIAQVTGQ